MTLAPLLELEAVRVDSEHAPRNAMDMTLSPGDFVLIECRGPRASAAFGDLCVGLLPLTGGSVRFLGRDWSTVPPNHADALRGHVGRLFHRPLRADTPDIADAIMLARLHHTRVDPKLLREQAAALALQFGLPGLPSGPARQLSEGDLLRAACVRAFLGQPKLVVVELPGAFQRPDLIPALLNAGAAQRGQGGAVLWLAAAGPVLRERAVTPTQRLRLTEMGLEPARSLERAS
jgi:phospholipid/cholesterol/gamma-HCH transport system ATP-binding protein